MEWHEYFVTFVFSINLYRHGVFVECDFTVIQSGQNNVEGTVQLGAFVIDTGGFPGLSDEFTRGLGVFVVFITAGGDE